MGNDVTFGDRNVELNTLDRYKGKKGQVDRIVLLSKSLLRGNSHWFNNKTFRCLTEDPSKPAICCEKLGAPNQKFGVVILHYQADGEGNIVDESKCPGTLKIWVLTESKYQELSGVHKQWPLLDSGFDKPQHDLLIACTEEQYQRMTITPCPKAHWKSREAWYKALLLRVDKSKDRLALSVGKKLPESEVLEILGLAVQTAAGTPGQPPTQGPGDIDLSDILADGKS